MGIAEMAFLCSPDWGAVLPALAAAVALIRWNVGVIPVIVASALAGLGLRWLDLV